MVSRACDSVQLFFEKLGADQNNEVFRKINLFREQAALRMAQEIIEKNKKQTFLPSFEFQTNVTPTQTQIQDVSGPIMSQLPPFDERFNTRSEPQRGSMGTNFGQTFQKSQKIEEEPVDGDYIIKKKFHQ